MNRLTKIISLVGLHALLLGQLLTPVAASAENGQALSITPPVMELQGEPGKTVTATIKVTNISAGDLLIKNQVNDFGAKNETGEPNIPRVSPNVKEQLKQRRMKQKVLKYRLRGR